MNYIRAREEEEKPSMWIVWSRLDNADSWTTFAAVETMKRDGLGI